jgi:hypothetical protein
MTDGAIRGKLVLGLAVLLAAGTAAADTVITAREVLSCSVETVDADSARLRLKKGKRRSLPAWDVYEVRLSDPNRVAELAALLPRAEVLPDYRQSIPAPEVRIREAMRLRLDRARARGLPEDTAVLDTLTIGASPDDMTSRCREMGAVLSVCGQSDRDIARLQSEINREAEELNKIPLKATPYTCGITCCGLMGGAVGAVLGGVAAGGLAGAIPGLLAGVAVGTIPGSAIGSSVGGRTRSTEVERHRGRVNQLIRGVNRVAASAP